MSARTEMVAMIRQAPDSFLLKSLVELPHLPPEPGIDVAITETLAELARRHPEVYTATVPADSKDLRPFVLAVLDLVAA